MRNLIILFFLSPLYVWSQEAISLEQALQLAMENNRTLQTSQLNIAKAKEIVKETYAIGLPQINGSVEYNNFLDVPVSVLPDFISPTVYGVLVNENLIDEGAAPSEPSFINAAFGTSNTLNAGISLSQLLFDGSYLVGLQATKVYLGITEIQSEIDVIDIRKNVSEAYYTVLIAQENVSTLTESKATIEKTFNEVSAMFQEGLMEENDVDQLQLTLTNLNNTINNASRQINLTKQLLKMHLGMELTSDITLSDNLESLLEEKTMNDANSTFTLGNLPEFKLLENNIKVQELMVKNSKMKYLPTLGGFFSYAQSAQRNEFNFLDFDQPWFPNTVWGVKLEVPIFSSGMKHSRVNQAKIDHESALIQKKEAEQGLTIASQKARSDYDYAKDNHSAQKSAFQLAEKIRNKTLIKYKEGLSSSFELNQIEGQYIDAQGAYLMSILNLLNSKEAYNKAFGL